MDTVRRVGWVTVRMDGRGVVVWSDDWSEARRMAYRGWLLKVGPGGELRWAGV
jgi:hypothetical protein